MSEPGEFPPQYGRSPGMAALADVREMMSEERKQEHAGVSVEMISAGVMVHLDMALADGAVLEHVILESGQPARRKISVILPTLESAEALRDALSAFITFHRRVG